MGIVAMAGGKPGSGVHSSFRSRRGEPDVWRKRVPDARVGKDQGSHEELQRVLHGWDQIRVN
jgi:hypothetical protein